MEFFFILIAVGVILLIHYLKASKAERKPRPKSEPKFGSGNDDSSNLAPKLASDQDAYHYELNPRLFTRAETSFFHALEAAVDGKLRIFGKVRIADVLKVKKGLDKSQWGFQFGRIKAKHFDYVLCTPNTLKVVCAIELDDSSHQKPDRVKRDEFVNAICKESGLKLHRFKIQKHYNPLEISGRIFPPKPRVEPVNPQAVITDIKQSLDENSDMLRRERKKS
ncbi:DUF2726 domain-containing protein [Pontibacterium granulatum]|uniref:DUF2726 domain-containing protein n=1 Tax=Pontibacterium granulatum TaxID=2036029 RepID=UPI002499FACE|nr:DUF2726 domain-containing protein [Pontibacterium granulatum]MDI3323932.1 DUF2726 domain-containing protein [Pontibacterium granulatum]